jgi:hypothetical protein
VKKNGYGPLAFELPMFPDSTRHIQLKLVPATK